MGFTNFCGRCPVSSLLILNKIHGVPIHGSVETNLTCNHEDTGLIPGLVEWVKDLVLLWLWCRSKMGLGSGIAIAVT